MRSLEAEAVAQDDAVNVRQRDVEDGEERLHQKQRDLHRAMKAREQRLVEGWREVRAANKVRCVWVGVGGPGSWGEWAITKLEPACTQCGLLSRPQTTWQLLFPSPQLLLQLPPKPHHHHHNYIQSTPDTAS